MENKIEIGQRLRKFIEKEFSSTTQLTKQLGKDKSYFTPYFSGKSVLGGETLAKLAHFGCDINYLLTGISLKVDLTAFQQQLEEMKKEIKDLKASHYDLSRKLDEKDSHIKELEEENSILKTTVMLQRVQTGLDADDKKMNGDGMSMSTQNG